MVRPERLTDAVTLYEGDCLEVLPTLKAGSVKAIITDPPYGINTKSDGNGKLNPWTDLCNSAFWYTTWMRECRRVLNPSGCLWTCFNWRGLTTLQKASCDAKWPIESLMIWDKRWIGPGGEKGLRPSYEVVALFAMPEFAIKNRGLPDVQAFPWSSHKPNGHPAEKPIDLMRFLVEHSTEAGDLVVDIFGGSGTTAVAAAELGRTCVIVEQDAECCSIIRRRVAQSDGTAPGTLFREVVQRENLFAGAV